MTTQSKTTTQQHTSGPWTIRTTGKSITVDSHARACDVARCSDTAPMLAGEMEANARLIAAAPDMLEALNAVLALPVEGLANLPLALARAKAVQAVAKATGAQS